MFYKVNIKGSYALFKTNDTQAEYMTYSNIHKIAILGTMGAIIGLGGYRQMKKSDICEKKDFDEIAKQIIATQNSIYPEFYNNLKFLGIGIAPCKNKFGRTKQKTNNIYGHAKQGEGKTANIVETILVNPEWNIYIKTDADEKDFENSAKEAFGAFLSAIDKKINALKPDAEKGSIKKQKEISEKINSFETYKNYCVENEVILKEKIFILMNKFYDDSVEKLLDNLKNGISKCPSYLGKKRFPANISDFKEIHGKEISEGVFISLIKESDISEELIPSTKFWVSESYPDSFDESCFYVHNKYVYTKKTISVNKHGYSFDEDGKENIVFY